MAACVPTFFSGLKLQSLTPKTFTATLGTSSSGKPTTKLGAARARLTPAPVTPFYSDGLDGVEGPPLQDHPARSNGPGLHGEERGCVEDAWFGGETDEEGGA